MASFNHSSFRALIVDDSEPIRSLLERIASEQCDEVLHAATLRDACLRSHAPLDLVIADVRLPDGTAHELFERCMQLRERPVLIAISGRASTSETFRLAQLGVDAFFAKPFIVREMSDVIRDLLRDRRARRDASRDMTSRSVEHHLLALVRKHELTEQQTVLLRTLLAGVPRRQLAEKLGVSENTCKTLVRRLLGRCGAHRLSDVVNELMARDAGSSDEAPHGARERPRASRDA